MATYLRATCTFQHTTGLPEDAVVNTWSFIGSSGGGRDADAAVIKTGLDAFYGAVKGLLSSQYAWNTNTLDIVDMADGKPRIPFYTNQVALGTLVTSSNDWPAEVALCLSMRGAQASGLNMRRRRGRVYIGPLQMGAVDKPVQDNAGVDIVATAGQALLSLTNVDLAIYSRATHHDVPVGEDIANYPNEVPALLDDAFVPATTVWCDNAWDIQRRRGVKPTYRKTLT